MSSPLPVDLRERVVSAVSEGGSCHQAARFGFSVSSASRWSEQFRQEGRLAPSRQAAITPSTGSRRRPSLS